ncbi:MAG: 50S ribosomal protein L2 [Candidatus Diapherotrites archaeon]|nr:50S ribosomal protein L2 [Candidatus Diapherotrites archaeon]
MGRRLIQQRRGKASSLFLARKDGTTAGYGELSKTQLESVEKAQVKKIFKDRGRMNVLAEVLMENNGRQNFIAAEGLVTGQEIEMGKNAKISVGNVMPLENIPEGCPVFNIEKSPGDGGVLVRGSGLYALVVSKEKDYAFVKMPSGQMKQVNLQSRATIGCSAGGGRPDKPMVKAGTAWHKAKARRKWFPTSRGVKMNVLDHPFGGSAHHAGKSKSTSRNAPPGRKVGAIGSKRTGRRKR